MQSTRPSSRSTDAASANVTIRRVESGHEYDECVAIQRETWGAHFSEGVPATILRVAQEVGGVTAAAFDSNGAMLGFVFGISGVRDGELAHWSDMLAVRGAARNMGLGKRLKAYQRDLLLQCGIRTMYWTYDPLVARNAYINLCQLGARVTEYRTNYYGENTGSVMHTGIGTDRFIVRWTLDGGVEPRASAMPPDDVPLVTPESPAVAAHSQGVRVAIPDDVIALLDSDPPLARRWRDTTRLAFTTLFGDGYRVTGFTRGTDAQPPAYLLQR